MPPRARSTHKTGATSAILTRDEFTMGERFNVLPRVLPFVLLLTGVMIALYGGYATPSETAGLGGLLALVLIALIYSVWRPSDLAPILKSTIRESTMLMMIIGMSLSVFLRHELSAHLAIGRGIDCRACTCRAGNCWRRSSSWW